MNTRYDIFLEMMDEMDKAYDLMEEYDSMPHIYGQETLYQAESHIIEMIGKNNRITVTEIAKRMKKTKSACSQMIRKLRNKGWVNQTRNSQNNREYNLSLSEDGWNIFKAHEEIDKVCFNRGLDNLNKYTDQELQLYLKIQQEINKSFKEDVEVSKKDFVDITKK